MITPQASRRRAPRPDLRFLFHTEDVTPRHTRPLLTVRADVAQWVAVNHDGTVRTPADEHRDTAPGGHELRNCSWTSRWDGLAGEWDSFTFTAQADGPVGWYGWRAEFHQPSAVDLPHARAMVAVLRRVDAQLARLNAHFGEPGGLAEWTTRVYTATGSDLAHPYGCRAMPGRDLNGTGWQWMDASDLRRWLDQQLATFCLEHDLAGGEDR